MTLSTNIWKKLDIVPGYNKETIQVKRASADNLYLPNDRQKYIWTWAKIDRISREQITLSPSDVICFYGTVAQAKEKERKFYSYYRLWRVDKYLTDFSWNKLW